MVFLKMLIKLNPIYTCGSNELLVEKVNIFYFDLDFEEGFYTYITSFTSNISFSIQMYFIKQIQVLLD